MRLRVVTRRTMLGCLIVPKLIKGDSDGDVLAAVHEMESREGVSILERRDAIFHRWRGARKSSTMTVWPAISPDGLALAWGAENIGEEGPFLTISSVQRGVQQVALEGNWAGGIALSSGPDFAVATALPKGRRGKARLVVVDLRAGATVSERVSLPVSVPFSIAGTDPLVAFVSNGRVRLYELSTGKSVFDRPGTYPRLSPDGNAVAFIREEHLYIASVNNDDVREMLPGTIVRGVGGWSPNGKFLLAAAWTRRTADEKRLVAIDTASGRYAELGNLGESDFGLDLRWISLKLLDR